jgi:hypothetical protein
LLAHRRLPKQAAGNKALYLINNGRRPFLSNTAKLQMRVAHLKFNPLRFKTESIFFQRQRPHDAAFGTG